MSSPLHSTSYHSIPVPHTVHSSTHIHRWSRMVSACTAFPGSPGKAHCIPSPTGSISQLACHFRHSTASDQHCHCTNLAWALVRVLSCPVLESHGFSFGLHDE